LISYEYPSALLKTNILFDCHLPDPSSFLLVTDFKGTVAVDGLFSKSNPSSLEITDQNLFGLD